MYAKLVVRFHKFCHEVILGSPFLLRDESPVGGSMRARRRTALSAPHLPAFGDEERAEEVL
eukprot:7986218-Alexandrium_andersonii.AAC.1